MKAKIMKIIENFHVVRNGIWETIFISLILRVKLLTIIWEYSSE